MLKKELFCSGSVVLLFAKKSEQGSDRAFLLEICPLPPISYQNAPYFTRFLTYFFNQSWMYHLFNYSESFF